MGFQSGINAMLGSVAGAAFGISKTLKDRQEEQMKKVQEQLEAKKTQQQRFKKSLILDAQGQNIMVPTTQTESVASEKKSIILGADGGKL